MIFIHLCDLSLMREIRNMAEDYKKQFKELNILINNVGAMNNKYELTSEAFESNFATNILGQYYLTILMLPVLIQTKPFAKVINVSSGGMLTQPLILDDYFMQKDFDGTKQYARNKRQMVALTEFFARLYTKEGVNFYSMHPGWVDTDGVRTSMPDFHKKFEKDLRPISQGIDTIDYLAVTPVQNLKPGEFYFDRQPEGKHLAISLTTYGDEKVEQLVQDFNKMLLKI